MSVRGESTLQQKGVREGEGRMEGVAPGLRQEGGKGGALKDKESGSRRAGEREDIK